MSDRVEDYEDDAKRKLSTTDPAGNVMQISACLSCGAPCVYTTEDAGNCYGEVNMLSDVHKCEFHRKHGSPEAWYESEPSAQESPFPQELGMGEAVKPLSNGGGTFENSPQNNEVDNGNIKENDISDDVNDDPRYTNG